MWRALFDRNRLDRDAIRLLLCAVVLAYAVALAVNPRPNWDVIGYSASVLSLGETSTDRIHELTFAELEAAYPPEIYTELTHPDWDTGYRTTVWQDPEALAQQIPWYMVKPALVLLMAALGAAGMLLPHAAHLVSVAAIAGAVLVLSRWGGRHLSLPAGVFVVVSILLSGAHHTGRLPTPDALSFLVLVGGLSLYAGGRIAWALAVLWAAIAVRPDNILLLGLVLAYGWALAPAGWRIRFRTCLVVGVAALILYGFLANVSGYYGYETIFHHGFLRPLPYPADHAASIPWDVYRSILAERSADALQNKTREAVYVLIGFLLLPLAWRRDPVMRLHAGLAFVASGYVVLHFLLLPDPNPRFFTAQFAAIWIAAALYVGRLAGASAFGRLWRGEPAEGCNAS